jgi:putative methyltransferase
LLPNTESDSTGYRNRYGLRTRFKDTHLDREEASRHGAVELVYETNSMPYDDWLYCRVFADCVIAMHNGGYTRFLAIYLNEMGLHGYYDFYARFFEHFFFSGESLLGPILTDSHLRYRDIVESVGAYEVSAALFANGHPKLHEQLKPYISDKKSAFYPCEYIWILVNERLDRFYEEVGRFLKDVLHASDPRLSSLLSYQKEIMLVPSYDPRIGKHVSYPVDWPEYFFGDGSLREKTVALHYTDVAMGVTYQDPLPPPGDVAQFAAAAVGWVWPLGRYRRYFHQPEAMVCESGG